MWTRIGETKELCVKLYLGDEIISNEFVSI